jgi:hypothetical protein
MDILWTPLNDLPDLLIEGTVAVEDKRFYHILETSVFVKDTVDTFVKEYNIVVNTVDNIVKVINLYSAFDAYNYLNLYQQDVLTEMAIEAGRVGNYELYSAIFDFISFL